MLASELIRSSPRLVVHPCHGVLALSWTTSRTRPRWWQCRIQVWVNSQKWITNLQMRRKFLLSKARKVPMARCSVYLAAVWALHRNWSSNRPTKSEWLNSRKQKSNRLPSLRPSTTWKPARTSEIRSNSRRRKPISSKNGSDVSMYISRAVDSFKRKIKYL